MSRLRLGQARRPMDEWDREQASMASRDPGIAESQRLNPFQNSDFD